jgi:diguanylate cyclase
LFESRWANLNDLVPEFYFDLLRSCNYQTMKTVLVIEDEALIRQYLVETLALNKFHALEAPDGLAGLDMIRKCRPDLILCDIRMPYFDGYDVLEAIRQDADLATTPFIFLSARASHSEVRQGMNLGADDYLIKPCRSRDLVEAIESAFIKRANFSRCYLEQVEEVKDQLAQLKDWDALTDLPNRSRFQEKLKALCDGVDLPNDRYSVSIAALSIKVTSYQNVCLILGKETGEQLLRAVANRLSTAGSPGFVARLGEDEFGVMLEDAGDHPTISEFTQTLLSILNVPYTILGEDVRLQCSVGIALFPQHSVNAEALLLQADMAMQWCQEQAATGYRFYNPAVVALENDRQSITTDLARAIERSQLELYYQPQIDLLTGKLTGVEALARWTHPERGIVSPESFIPVAEASGLIAPLGEWALRSACQQSMAWSEHLRSPISISVNLSMRQFENPGLMEMIAQILHETRMPPNLLVLELTESSLMCDVNVTIEKLHQLKKLGVKLAIDDFGTGYSSLSYLSQLPIDELKIDQSFVRQLHRDRNATMISSTIIFMAKSMGLKVVAEGIENQQQRDFLVKAGCHIGQGFLYSKPMDSQTMIKWFNNPASPSAVY